MKKAVLLITFNRFDYIKKVFEQIAIAKPPRLYLASDGSRVNKEGEKELVENVRKYLLKNINWDCEVKTRFLETNSGGCGLGVSGAITWFFDNEEDGIILEDDCVPNQSFFYFCEDLLDYYKDDKRIWHIAGYNPLNIARKKSTYYFAKIQHCWGWASWANKWKHFEFDLKNYKEKHIKKFSKDKNVRSYWLNILNAMKNKEIDTWDYQWTFCIIKNNGFCINPSKNLVSNIGITGIHYEDSGNDKRLNTKTYSLTKIIHPKSIKCNKNILNKIYKRVFNIVLEKEQKRIEQIKNINDIQDKLEETNKKLNNLINLIAWWIPIKKWREDFRKKFQ